MTLGKNLENGTTQTEYAYNVAGGLASTAFYVAGTAVEALTGNFMRGELVCQIVVIAV